jgi:negative elongation factor E
LEEIPSTRVKPLYESFVSSRDPESIAREETYKEKRRDGKANYVNRDSPLLGNTIYVHGFGLNENILRTSFSIFGNILNVTSETDKKFVFLFTFNTLINY